MKRLVTHLPRARHRFAARSSRFRPRKRRYLSCASWRERRGPRTRRRPPIHADILEDRRGLLLRDARTRRRRLAADRHVGALEQRQKPPEQTAPLQLPHDVPDFAEDAIARIDVILILVAVEESRRIFARRGILEAGDERVVGHVLQDRLRRRRLNRAPHQVQRFPRRKAGAQPRQGCVPPVRIDADELPGRPGANIGIVILEQRSDSSNRLANDQRGPERLDRGDARVAFGRRFDERIETRYCENVKNITVSVDDEIYRRARVKAAASGASVSRLVRSFLVAFAREETEFDRLKREEQALRDQIVEFSAGDRLSREAVHARR